MKKVEFYWFVGSIYQRNKVNKFTVSIYASSERKKSKDKRYYRHLLNEDRIEDFQEIIVDAKINKADQNRQVSRGDRAVYCYTNEKNELMFGHRQELEQKILPLLFSDQMNVHSKLTISSFLKLHGKTYDLINKYEQQLLDSGLHFKIYEDDFIQTKMSENSHLYSSKNFLNSIFKRQNMLKNLNKKLFLSDFALLQNTKVYFDKSCVPIENILSFNKNHQSGKLDDLISFSIKSNRIDLGISLKESKKLYIYILRSQIDIDQKKIESLLSTVINKKFDTNETSALEIGIKVDEQLSQIDKPMHQDETSAKLNRKIQELDEDVQKILDQYV